MDAFAGVNSFAGRSAIQRLVDSAWRASGVKATPANLTSLEKLHQLSSAKIGGLTGLDSIAGLTRLCPWLVWSFHQSERLVGGVALLPLDPAGLQELRNDTLDRMHPPIHRLLLPPREPVALYIWALNAPGRGFFGLADVIVQTAAVWSRAPIYVVAATPDGQRASKAFGFEPVEGAAHLQVLRRGGDHDQV